MLAQVADQVQPFIHWDIWLLVLGLVTPFVTAILTKVGTNDTVKGGVSVVLTAGIALMVTAMKDGSLTWELFVNGWLQILLVHAGSYFMLTSKPVQRVHESTGGVVGGGDVAGPIVDPERPYH